MDNNLFDSDDSPSSSSTSPFSFNLDDDHDDNDTSSSLLPLSRRRRILGPSPLSVSSPSSYSLSLRDDRLFLVPHSWWREAGVGEGRENGGVVYTVSSDNDSSRYWSIVLHLKQETQENSAVAVAADDKVEAEDVKENAAADAGVEAKDDSEIAVADADVEAKDIKENAAADADADVKVKDITENVAAADVEAKEIGGIAVADVEAKDNNEYDDDKEKEKEGGVGLCGREYALITESMWYLALKWYSDNCTGGEEEDDDRVFALKIRLSAERASKSLMVKISNMDNSFLEYDKACQIFDLKSYSVCIWDFSGQMTNLFEGDDTMLPNDGLELAAEEVPLELQVYGLPNSGNDKQVRKTENAISERSADQGPSSSCSTKMNGNVENGSYTAPFVISRSPNRGFGKAGLLGLTGLVNLGNTCFMNSALQCLSHTPKLVDYFLGDYKKEINYENPLGMKGELVLAFGDLLRKLWAPGRVPVSPRFFKSTLEKFAPQFSGYNQHDSQELLAFLLDGLHEDLNRVKHKPYIEATDAEGHPDDIVAAEYWQNHLARNNSVIVDLCQGQYRSTLVCPICKRVSITFDPFMYLSLPLLSTMRFMTVTLISSDGCSAPSSLTVSVPNCGSNKDLIQALSMTCSLRNDETLLVAEVFNNRIWRFLDDPSQSLAEIRNNDYLVAYRLPKESDNSQLVFFMHQRTEWRIGYGEARSWRLFGFPLVARISNLVNGSQIYCEYNKLLRPFNNMDEDDYGDGENADDDIAKMKASMSSSDQFLSSDDEAGVDWQACFGFQCHFTNRTGFMRGQMIELSKPVDADTTKEKLYVLVSWREQMERRYDVSRLGVLPVVFETGTIPQESVSLYKCVEGFLKEEPLGPEDMWYCPSCKEHRQASKKLDLWRLPEILVVHLKRFSYSRFQKNKLETNVDFPIDKLDLTGFLENKNAPSSNCYKLFAISNHDGNLGGGHYTALVYHGTRWYEFNDSSVGSIKEEDVKTPAAYVLFYRRVTDTSDSI